MHYQIHTMIVCLCHPTSERELDAIIDDGARTVEEISRRCGAGTGCGACIDEMRERLASRGATSCPRDVSGMQQDLIAPTMLAPRAR